MIIYFQSCINFRELLVSGIPLGFDESEKFDFIVVGSGPSGAVLANRLTEDPQRKVLLLEAGGQPFSITDFPFLSGYWQFTNISWGYYTEENKRSCLGK